ncbi:MAG: uroporphyrinogen-III synthase [Alphaproteobacteria bacterium]
MTAARPRHALITRPQPEADETALALRALDLAVTVAPMLEIVALPAPETMQRLDDVQAVVLTSASAARALIHRPLGARLMERDLPVFAVGESTAAAARAVGFGHVVSADGDGDDLVALVAERTDPRRGAILYPCGVHTARDLRAALAAVDRDCVPVPVYEARAVEALPREIEHGLRRRHFDLVLFYSARTAGIFADLVEAYGLEAHLADAAALCLSQGVAGRAQALRWGAVEVASHPDGRSMLALVRELVLQAPHRDRAD